MGFFDRLFSAQQHISDPVTLRRELFDAASKGDRATLDKLCRNCRATILDQFATWSNVRNYSDFDPKDPKQLQYIINGLSRVAEFFRDELGDPSLWNRLTKSDAENPFNRFKKTLDAAQSFLKEKRYSEAIELFTSYLIEIKNIQGPAPTISVLMVTVSSGCLCSQ